MGDQIVHRVFFVVLCLLMLGFRTQAQDNDEAQCKLDPTEYQQKHYVVRSVRIDTPLSWLFGSVKNTVDDIVLDPEMPIKKGTPFLKVQYDAGHNFVARKLQELSAPVNARFSGRVVWLSLANCDTTSHELDVVYRAYSVSFSSTFIRTFEIGGKDEVSRGVVKTGATQRLRHAFIQPYGSYNRSRAIVGGAKFSATTPVGFIETLALDASGSSSSSEVNFEAGGTSEREKGILRFKEWMFGYTHYSVPGHGLEIKRGSVNAQLLMATRPFGNHELVVRFGGALEGGNGQTNLEATKLLATEVASSGLKSFKAFVGGDMRLNRHVLKASYGIQLANASNGTSIDYIKQIFDSGAALRFLPWGDHNPVTVEAQFNAGWIHTRGLLPASEKFFGGNAQENFINGSSWIIQNGPFIRSFPENQFATTSTNSLVGGNKFFSANLTIAPTIWRVPLVPEEILNDCADQDEDDDSSDSDDENPCITIDDAMGLQLDIAEKALRTAHLSETKEFQNIASEIRNLSAPLVQLRDELCPYVDDQDFRDKFCPGSPPITDPQLRDLGLKLFKAAPKGSELEPEGSYARVVRKVNKLLIDIQEDRGGLDDVRVLAVGQTGKPNTSYIEKMAVDVQNLSARLPASEAQRMDATRTTITGIGTRIHGLFDTLQRSSAGDKATQKAERDMIYPRRVVREMVHEANLISFSPAVFLDAARLWQNREPVSNVRFGTGAGLRFSLVSLDVTTGYSWNMNRRPWEPRGAFIFSMELSNLFK